MIAIQNLCTSRSGDRVPSSDSFFRQSWTSDLLCLLLPAAPKQCELNIYRRVTACLSFNPYSLRSNMPRSRNDSWLQKSLKTRRRRPWCLPDLSSGHFLQQLFWGSFPSSFQRTRNWGSHQPRATFHPTLWHRSAQRHRAPGFGEPPMGSGARSAPTRIDSGNAAEAPEHQGRVQTPLSPCKQPAASRARHGVTPAQQVLPWPVPSVSPGFSHSFANLP